MFIKLFFLLTIVQTGNSFFQQIFNLGARTSNCLPWSLWSPCFSTKEFMFLFRFPGYCYYNSYGQQFQSNGGVSMVEQAYQYLKRVNASYTPCGQCLWQVSCSRQCNLYGPQSGLYQGQVGFSTQLCDDNRMDQSEACLLNLLATDGVCQMWPPVRDVLQAPYGAKIVKDQLYALPSTSCQMIGNDCYCCCLPYVPDPATRRCRLGLVT